MADKYPSFSIVSVPDKPGTYFVAIHIGERTAFLCQDDGDMRFCDDCIAYIREHMGGLEEEPVIAVVQVERDTLQ